MDDTFKIYVQRLNEGESEEIEESLNPAFLAILEDELAFRTPVKVKGEAVVSGGTLILRLKVEAEATMPCAICNADVREAIVCDFCHTESLEEIKSGVFDYSVPLREAILLEVPYKAECHQGKCPEREKLAKYLK